MLWHSTEATSPLSRGEAASYAYWMANVELPSVVCILVNWNGWEDTLRCLESFKTNSYNNLALVLVDNGSTDDSVARIRNAHPDLEMIESQTNLGFGAGNNLGIRCAIGRGAKYVWLLNNDTVIQPNTLAELVAAGESDSSVGAVGSVLHYLHAPDTVQAWGGGHVNLWMGTSYHFHSPVSDDRLDFITAASVLLPTSVLEQIGLFDELYFMYWEDTDLCFRIRRAGWKLAVARKAVLFHKEGASTRAKSEYFDGLVTSSGVSFLKKYSALPLLSVMIFVGGRAIKRLLAGRAKASIAILKASVS